MQLSTLTEEGSLQRQLICQLQSIQDHLDRISKHKGVKGVLIAGHDGSIHKSTLDVRLLVYQQADAWICPVDRMSVCCTSPFHGTPSCKCRSCCWISFLMQEHLKHEYADMIPSLTALARNMVRELDPQVGQPSQEVDRTGPGRSANCVCIVQLAYCTATHTICPAGVAGSAGRYSCRVNIPEASNRQCDSATYCSSSVLAAAAMIQMPSICAAR